MDKSDQIKPSDIGQSNDNNTFYPFNQCIDLNEILPFVKNRGEASTLITAAITSQKLYSALRMLDLSVQNELLIKNAMEKSQSLPSHLVSCIHPYFYINVSLSEQRYEFQRKYSNQILEEISRLCISLKQFGEQNLTLSQELSSVGCNDLAQHKKKIARFELDLCRKLKLVANSSATIEVNHLNSSNINSKKRKHVNSSRSDVVQDRVLTNVVTNDTTLSTSGS